MRHPETFLIATLTAFCLLVVVTGSPVVAAGSEAAEAEALAAAEEWLALVDAGDYQKSWEGAASLFKSAVTPEQWEQSLRGALSPLGAMKSRKEKNRRYETSLPGAPDGEYVIFQFDTSFENKQAAVETVTPMKDTDGKWRVSGYWVK